MLLVLAALLLTDRCAAHAVCWSVRAEVATALFGNPDDQPVVCFNGAVAAIMGPTGLPKRILSCERLSPQLAVSVLELASKLDYPVQWCDLDATYNTASSETLKTILRKLESLDGNESEQRDCLSMARAGLSPLKLVMVTGDAQSADRDSRTARSALQERCHVIAAEVHVEFLPANCNKASALSVVLEELQRGWDEVAFFGDNNNDVEALQMAAIGFAMPNGVQAAKVAADAICCASNAEGGVPKQVCKLFQNKVDCDKLRCW